MRLDTIAERLKYARSRKGFTQEELAKMTNTSQDVIQKIENGKSLRPRNIEKIAKALDVSPAWLQFGSADLDKLDADAVKIAIRLSDLTPEQRKIVDATLKTLINSL